MELIPEKTPPPLRVRFFDRDGKVAGHWFARPDETRLEQQGWKLSFRYPGFQPRKRLDGSGWSGMVAAMISQACEVAHIQDQHFRRVLAQAEAAAKHPPRKGFRPKFIHTRVNKLKNDLKRWRREYAAEMREHIAWAAEAWGAPARPIIFPWEMPTAPAMA